ncbi:MAG: heparinase II/III family protein [Pseudomonadota bacterium]
MTDFLQFLPGPSVPERFVLTPPDLRPATAELARDYYNGQYCFVGQTVQAGHLTPFSVQSPSENWERELHSFRWLRHMAAAPGQLAAAQAKTLVSDWLETSAKSRKHTITGPNVTSMRLIALLQYGRFLLTGADHRFYRDLMRTFAVHVAALQRARRVTLPPMDEMQVNMALAIASVSLPVNERVHDKAIKRLAKSLEDYVFPDGGIVTHNPDDLADVTADLLALAKSYIALDRPVPSTIVHGLDRMLPRLRVLVHADGELATFHGSTGTRAPLVAALLASDETTAKATARAPQSGFTSMFAGDSRLIFDVGAGAPPGDARYQSTSAFEFSSGSERLFINVGSPPSGNENKMAIGRGAAAHNRLVFAGVDAVQVDGANAQLKPWPNLASGEIGHFLDYETTVDELHMSCRRGIRLSKNGTVLDGFDRVLSRTKGPNDLVADVYFHLMRNAKVTIPDQGRAVVETAGGQRWVLETDAQKLSVQKSIQLAHPAGLQNIECLTLSFNGDEVSWRWRKVR